MLRRYRRTLKTDDRLAWIRQVCEIRALFRSKKVITDPAVSIPNSRNLKKLWKSMSSVLERYRNESIQSSSNITADKLAHFSIEKVGVRAAIMTLHRLCSVHTVDTSLTTLMTCRSMTCARSSFGHRLSHVFLTPLPTFLLLEVVDALLPIIWVMVNESLQEGCLPCSQKAAIITLVLKKAHADPVKLKDNRPISSLTFMSKVIE